MERRSEKITRSVACAHCIGVSPNAKSSIAACADAPVWENRRMQIISPKDGFSFSAHHAAAQGTRRGGVVVIQEIFGVTNHMREVCDRFAAEGYEAIAPSLFDRAEPGFEANVITPDVQQHGLSLANRTPFDQVGADLQACIDKLAGPVFAVGFCWGGVAAWVASARCQNLAAASCFYGRRINERLTDAPRVPVTLHYGKKDAGIPPDNIGQVHQAYPNVPIHMYDAGHGFCREGGDHFDAPSRDLGMARTLEFFAANAGGPRAA
jgi:carboxymethylenebutenolidase